MLFGDQKDHSYLINYLTDNVHSNRSTFFIAGICAVIIPFVNHVYLFEIHSRDVFGMSCKNTFFICIKFPKYEIVATYIYNSFVNSAQVQLENQLINFIISDFPNELIPVSLIDSESYHRISKIRKIKRSN